MLQYPNEKKTCKDFDDDKIIINIIITFVDSQQTNYRKLVMQYIYLTQIWFGECD